MEHPVAVLQGLLGELADLVAPHRCAGCDAPYPRHPPLCARCMEALEPAEDPPAGVIVPYAWGGPLAEAIARAKDGPHPAPAALLGALLAPSARALVGQIDRVLPVPLHPKRLAQRGYNQSVELSRAVVKVLRCPVDYDLVRRVRDTPTQRALGRAAREANVRDAFEVVTRKRVAGLRVLVIDDVVTTGATVAAVRHALVSAGATVQCLALARAPLHSP